jgi:hypothetical protein
MCGYANMPNGDGELRIENGEIRNLKLATAILPLQNLKSGI